MDEEVFFYSHGCRLSATLMWPTREQGDRLPAIVHGPGWLGLRSAKLYRPYHQALLEAGFVVLTFDYRGFGDSEGNPSYVDPTAQVEDLRAAVSFLETRSEVDMDRIGIFGSGGTGGGNAVMAAGLDSRLRAVVSQVPIADGADWLRRARSEHEWLEFLRRLEQDRRTRAVTGHGEMVAPREGITPPTPERRRRSPKADVDARVAQLVDLASADAILAYRPIDVVERIAPRGLMLICVENDATTPEEHAYALFRRAGSPKRLIVQTKTSHYAAYERYGELVTPLIVEWFTRFLRAADVLIEDGPPAPTVTYLTQPDGAASGQ